MYDRLKELGVPVKLTRDSDVDLSASERPQRVLDQYGNGKDVIVISNHINAGGGDSQSVTKYVYRLKPNKYEKKWRNVMNISYTKNGDYLLPNLILENKKQYNIGKYGVLRLNYIKKYKLGLYFDLLVNDKLNEYLHNIDIIVMEMVQKLINGLTEKENITEKLKSSNQMLWISKMNNIKNIANEIILKEYIYV